MWGTSQYTQGWTFVRVCMFPEPIMAAETPLSGKWCLIIQRQMYIGKEAGDPLFVVRVCGSWLENKLLEHHECRVVRLCAATMTLKPAVLQATPHKVQNSQRSTKPPTVWAFRLQIRECPVALALVQMRQQPKTGVQVVERRKQLKKTSSSFPSPKTRRRISHPPFRRAGGFYLAQGLQHLLNKY